MEMLAGTTNEIWAELFALMVTGHDGEHVTPAGNPLIPTETAPVKPFTPVTEIVTGVLVVPICVLNDTGATVMEKSIGFRAGRVGRDSVSGTSFADKPCVFATARGAIRICSRDAGGEEIPSHPTSTAAATNT